MAGHTGPYSQDTRVVRRQKTEVRGKFRPELFRGLQREGNFLGLPTLNNFCMFWTIVVVSSCWLWDEYGREILPPGVCGPARRDGALDWLVHMLRVCMFLCGSFLYV